MVNKLKKARETAACCYLFETDDNHLHLYIKNSLCENCVNDFCISIIFLDSSDDVDQQGGQLTPEQDAMQHIKACKDKSFLKEMFINSTKGWS